jgi:hypothetical protein
LADRWREAMRNGLPFATTASSFNSPVDNETELN